jgi:hypothetical protein
MPKRDVDQICEIAARLSEDAGALRELGLHDAADLLQAVEADLEGRLYGEDCGGEIVYDDGVHEKPRRGRRHKGREVRTH